MVLDFYYWYVFEIEEGGGKQGGLTFDQRAQSHVSSASCLSTSSLTFLKTIGS